LLLAESTDELKRAVMCGFAASKRQFLARLCAQIEADDAILWQKRGRHEVVIGHLGDGAWVELAQEGMNRARGEPSVRGGVDDGLGPVGNVTSGKDPRRASGERL